ncbi:MAG: radical SAM protein [Caldisericales bacterium]|nr:radical SAM protein [Caldisericales bacterium]
MKVLLLNPPFIPEFIRSSRWAAASVSGSNWYPIYLAYCGGNLEKNGHEIKLIDGPVDKLSHEDVLRIAEKFSPDICVIYVSTVSLDNDISIGEKIIELTGCHAVLVGPWCSIDPDSILKKCNKINSLAIGEFDYTVLEFVEGVSKNKIAGLVWKNGNEIIHNSPRKPLTSNEISELPFVTDVYKRHLNIYNYYQAPHLHPFVDLFTGRGCSWGKCTFCLWPHTINKGANYRVGDINKTIDELTFIKKELPFVKEVFIQDDTLPPGRAKELSENIIENDIDIAWSCYVRAEARYDLDLLTIMKKSGCRCLHVGYESSSSEILKNIRKGITATDAEKFAKRTNKIGLLNHADFIIGLPGETVESIKETVEWAKKLPVDSYQFTIPKPYPNTPLYDYLEYNRCLKDGWANYPNLSSEDIQKWTRWALRQTNMNPKFLLRMLGKPTEWRRLARSARHVIPKSLR